MHRPIGVTILALAAGVAGLFEVWRALVFAGVASFTFIGKPVSFDEAQWGSVFWAVILALIWFWVAAGFWNLRAYAWSFGNFISLFTIIFGFFALLGGSTMEAEIGRLASRDRDLLLPELPGRARPVRPARVVLDDARAAGRDGTDAGGPDGHGPGDRRECCGPGCRPRGESGAACSAGRLRPAADLLGTV